MALRVEKVENTDKWRLLEPVVCPLDSSIVVPAGFLTDFASVPSAVQSLMSNTDEDILIASVVHDYLYEVRPKPLRYLKKINADEMFYRLCRLAGMGYVRAKLAYFGVRMFGRGSYA